MKVISVNIGVPRELLKGGKKIQTGIFKEPVDGPVEIHFLGLEGDVQVNRKIHGGIYKAVCLYPAEHYDAWKMELEEPELPFGAFGENLTTLGLTEDTVCLGDCLRIGSAELVVTQGREPCSNLSAKFGLSDLAKRFLRSGRTGFYFSVVKEGTVVPGDSIEFIRREENRVTVAEFNRILIGESGIEDILRRAREVNSLPKQWKDKFSQRLP
ncbi:molybdenum cofactor biosysynthesis protein [Candidatus Nitromaritima sp. SCGC AAA799-A02]|nr:molybdenum cofactor biosysynthesis protein [Candidatus Nitromaritima sp. SCGC AAA799-A02]